MNHSLEDLEALAVKFDTDKQVRQNRYLTTYLEYFERQDIKRDAPLKILEIGTNKGSSLRMWAEYFPNAQVFGIDITRRYELSHILNHDRIQTTLAHQGSRNELCQALSIFDAEGFEADIIIDDGSHDQRDQQVSLAYLFPMLRPGGLYVIEDLITGEPWMNGDLYNPSRISKTRHMIMILEATGKVISEVMEPREVELLEQTIEHCKYIQTPGRIFIKHLPQIAFLTARK